MTNTGAGAGETARIGERPARGSASGCATCGHPYAMHSNGKTSCRAFACTAGPGHAPCPEFAVAAPAAEPEEGRLAS